MKIQELLENFPGKDPMEKKEILPFDLADDLMFFMRNDDDFYRKNYYPHIVKCKQHVQQGRDLSSRVFQPLVQHAYEVYQSKFPIRSLPESLDEEMCEEICSQLRTEEFKHISKKIY